MRNTLCINDACNEVSVSGIGRHLGIRICWRVHWRSDGAFVEEINGKELNFLWGYDGQPSSSCWEVDTAGVSRSLEYDDHEAVLISTWVRTGMWLRPHLTDRLDLELVEESHLADAELSSWPGSTQRQPSNGKSTSNGALAEQQEDSLTPAGFVSMRVRLKGGRLNNTVHVCTSSWVVQSLQQPLSGDLETWHFGTWRPWTADMRVLYPSELIHQAIAGGRHVYKVQACNTQPEQLPSAFQMPVMPLLPADTEYDDSFDSAVPVWRSISGHLLVRPLINGKDSGGYMILDTGASGFVITQSAAIALGLASFGELYAASISGKVQTQFVRAHNWTLGPISIQQPVMMTMTLDGLVRGGPMDGDVIGITGYDLFRRAVVQLPRMCEAGVMQPALITPHLPLSATARSGEAATQAEAQAARASQAVPQAFQAVPQAPLAVPQAPLAVPQAPQAMPQAAAPDPTLPMRSALDVGSAESSTTAASGQEQGAAMAGLSDATPHLAQTGSSGGREAQDSSSSSSAICGVWDSSSGSDDSRSSSVSHGAQDDSSNSRSRSVRSLGQEEGVSEARRCSNPGNDSSSSSSSSSNDPMDSKLSDSSNLNTGSRLESSSSDLSSSSAGPLDAQLEQTRSDTGQTSTSGPSPLLQPSPSSSIDRQSSSVSSMSSSSNSNCPGESTSITGRASESTAIRPESSDIKIDTISMGSAAGDARSNGKSRGSRRSQTVKVERLRSRSPSPSPSRVGCPQYTMHLYNPGEFKGAAARGWQWHHFSMISNLPHLEVTFETRAGTRASSLFMLDTGACGSDIMLHARAIQELQMRGLGRSTTQYVRGVGGSNNTRVETVDLPWIEVAGVRCHKVKCMYAKGISGLDISIYSAGILGGDLLARLEVIIDYARKRLGVRKQ